MENFPVLYTNRLILRKLEVDDILSLVKHANNKNISRYILNIPSPYYENDAVFRISYVHQGFKTKTRYTFSIALKETNEFIGEISLHLDNAKNIAQLGYWIGEVFWNTGYITEAIAAILNFGFTKLSLAIIFASCEKENIASIKVLEKNNFVTNHVTGNLLQYSIKSSYLGS